MSSTLIHTDITQLDARLSDGTLLSENPLSYTDARYQRFIRAALAGPAMADAPVLLRHLMRAESEQQDALQHFRIARDTFPYDISSWSRFGIATTSFDSYYRVHAMPWHPNWLADVDEHGVDGAACALQTRRPDLRCMGDPFLTSFNFSSYQSEGQREAVRAVLEAPPGSTLIVNLPTGSGKSLCAYIAGKIPFTEDAGKGLTLVIVPTTALALDQERATQTFFPESTAYYAADSEESRDRNQEIRSRIRSGQQRISPHQKAFWAVYVLLSTKQPVKDTYGRLSLMRHILSINGAIIFGQRSRDYLDCEKRYCHSVPNHHFAQFY